jgi:hypothetical protein
VIFLSSRRVELISLACLALLTLGTALLFINHPLDRSFLTFRVVDNLRAGYGFAYNPGEPPLILDSSPFYALLLNLLAPLSDSFPLLSGILGALSILLGGITLYALMHDADPWTAGAAAGLYGLSPILWISLGLDVSLWMALCLIGMWLYLREWEIPAALVLSIAALLRPEAAALLLVLLADFIVSGRPFKPVAAGFMALLLIIGLLWMGNTFGTIGPLPGAARPTGILSGQLAPTSPGLAGENVLTGLGAVAAALFASMPLWIVMPLLALVGLIRLRYSHPTILLVGWALLHLLILAVLGVGVYAWDFAPLLAALSTLAGLGIGWLVTHVKPPGAPWALGAIASVLLASAAAQSLITLGFELSAPLTTTPDALHPLRIEPGYADAGEWLRENTRPEARIGTTRPGLLGYAAAQRPIVDPVGILQRDQPDLPPGDVLSWLADTRPDVLVLRDSEVSDFSGYALDADPWFQATYAEATRFPIAGEDSGDLIIFRTSGESRPFSEALMSMVPIPPDLTLNRIGADFSLEPLEGGRKGLISIQWLAGPQTEGERYVAIRIESRDGTIAALNGRTLDFTGWPARTLVTSYHPIDLAPNLAPGVYDIAIGLGPDAQNINWYPVTQAKVPFPEGALVGGFSGARAQFGEIDLIGYRLNRAPEGLEVLLLWQAAQSPITDYVVWVQIRDAAGQIVASLEAEPHDGAYPTSAWSSGEQVPDTYRIDITGLVPGEYEVYAGLIAPDGTRLRTAEGTDAVLVGHLSIAQQ